MYHDLNIHEKKLADFMSELSERCYAAGWMENLEYVLWETTLNGPRDYGQFRILEDDIHQMIQLSNNCNCWIYFDDSNEETSIPLRKWVDMYEETILTKPNIINRKKFDV